MFYCVVWYGRVGFIFTYCMIWYGLVRFCIYGMVWARYVKAVCTGLCRYLYSQESLLAGCFSLVTDYETKFWNTRENNIQTKIYRFALYLGSKYICICHRKMKQKLFMRAKVTSRPFGD